MRDWLNAILVYIGSATMTDLEYNSLNFLTLDVNVYSQSAYDQLSSILLAREAVSTMQRRLFGLFLAKGADIREANVAKTNILLGSAL